jgi:hypothetical protein
MFENLIFKKIFFKFLFFFKSNKKKALGLDVEKKKIN